jgi:hypothetical protein
VKKKSFGLLELEMADLERFWRKTPLGPLGINFLVSLGLSTLTTIYSGYLMVTIWTYSLL